MEVLFAVAGCLGAFALGLLSNRLCAHGRAHTGARHSAEGAPQELSPALARQWEDFLRYDGRAEGDEYGDED